MLHGKYEYINLVWLLCMQNIVNFRWYICKSDFAIFSTMWGNWMKYNLGVFKFRNIKLFSWYCIYWDPFWWNVFKTLYAEIFYVVFISIFSNGELGGQISRKYCYICKTKSNRRILVSSQDWWYWVFCKYMYIYIGLFSLPKLSQIDGFAQDWGFLHAKLWIPGGENSIFTVVIH